MVTVTNFLINLSSDLSLPTVAIAFPMVLTTVMVRWICLRLQQRSRRKLSRLEHQEQRETPPESELLQDEETSEVAQLAVDQAFLTHWNYFHSQRETFLFWLRLYWWCGHIFVPASGIALCLLLFPFTQSQGALLAAGLVKLAVLGSGVLFLRNIAHQVTDQYLQAWVRRSNFLPDEFQKTRIQLRSTTLRDTFHGIIQFTAGVILIFGFLGWNGVSLKELLTGTGVIGIAFGFAFKNLLNDWLQGFLVIFEDQYAVGDIIQMGDLSGRVEHISLRRTLLRSLGGRVTTIPHNRLGIVHNRSKDWSRVDFRITIAQDSSLEIAMAIVKEVAESMEQDEQWGSDILGLFNPTNPVTVSKLDHLGIELFIRIKTQRRRFSAVEREYRRRLKLAFDAHDIKIGMPQQSVTLRDEN